MRLPINTRSNPNLLYADFRNVESFSDDYNNPLTNRKSPFAKKNDLYLAQLINSSRSTHSVFYPLNFLFINLRSHLMNKNSANFLLNNKLMLYFQTLLKRYILPSIPSLSKNSFSTSTQTNCISSSQFKLKQNGSKETNLVLTATPHLLSFFQILFSPLILPYKLLLLTNLQKLPDTKSHFLL